MPNCLFLTLGAKLSYNRTHKAWGVVGEPNQNPNTKLLPNEGVTEEVFPCFGFLRSIVFQVWGKCRLSPFLLSVFILKTETDVKVTKHLLSPGEIRSRLPYDHFHILSRERDYILLFSCFETRWRLQKIISHGPARKNEADSHENSQDREFSLSSALSY